MAAKKSAVKKSAAKKPAAANDTFQKLRGILMRHAKELVVVKDTSEWVYLDTHTLAPNGKQPLFFGGVRNGKAYTSYYLMPVYADPKLLNGMSPALKKRMQGKSCFNFKDIDKDLLAEVSSLTKKCFEAWKKKGCIKSKSA